MAKNLFTSESVTEGHPDKICDQISDAVLDSIIAGDPNARVACETCVTTGLVLIMGEITTNVYCDIPKVARQVIKEIGYDNLAYGFDGGSCAVITAIDEQSRDIAMGVERALEVRSTPASDDNNLGGAGDQGMMFGYACDETPELMPLAISLAHKLAGRMATLRKDGTLDYLRPDGKTQVTVEYKDGKPYRIDTVVMSTQHAESVNVQTIQADLIKHLAGPILPEHLLKDTRYLVNPTGRFVIGGPHGDAGLTGRKIIVDTYGGYGRHGGGCFSGKDPTKVDRSAAYMARYAAKNVVAAGLASRCELQLSYAIGVAEPVSVRVDTFGTGKVDDLKLAGAIREVFSFTPNAIIRQLDLRKPIYRALAAYGHMGREDLGVAWECTDKAQEILRALG
ncbi:MAG: methionine adenosyltransferase [Oscillospiraceae bacterium]|nr:methionine adenosyltransferase [Oscillospiraceae bacterium]